MHEKSLQNHEKLWFGYVSQLQGTVYLYSVPPHGADLCDPQFSCLITVLNGESIFYRRLPSGRFCRLVLGRRAATITLNYITSSMIKLKLSFAAVHLFQTRKFLISSFKYWINLSLSMQPTN